SSVVPCQGDHEMSVLGHFHLVTRMDQRGRIRLLDHGRTGEAEPRRERRAPVDGRFERLVRVIENDLPRVDLKLAFSLPWLGEPIFRHGVTALCRDDQPYAHDFERFGGRGLPIAAVVLLVETLPDGTGL